MALRRSSFEGGAGDSPINLRMSFPGTYRLAIKYGWRLLETRVHISISDAFRVSCPTRIRYSLLRKA